MYRYLFVIALLWAFVGCSNPKSDSNKYLLYIGTYTDEGSKGIYVSEFDTAQGKLLEPKLAAKITNPSFQYITKDGSLLWSVSEAEDGTGLVRGFDLNKTTGELKSLSSFATGGIGPCYVSMDETKNIVMAANYKSGNVFIIPVDENGTATGKGFNHQHTGKGPNLNRQEDPHAHSIRVGPDSKYVYSADLGTDKIYVYAVDHNQLNLYTELSIAPGSGPRHIDFHPGKKAMAVVNELKGTVTLFKPDNTGCFSQYYSTTSTLPPDFDDFNKCADVHFSPDGKFLYASNRGHNSIVIFKVNQETMDLETVGWQQETIVWPRNFTIAPSGNYLLVANKDANTITVFTVNKKNGILTYTGNSIEVSKPVCLNLIKIEKKL